MATPVTVKIKFKSPTVDHFVERYSVDVSEGGIFIRTPKPLSVGTNVNFEFQLQDHSPLLDGAGTVVWVREMDPKKAGVSPGMGIRFDKLGPGGDQVLNRVLEHKQKAEEFADEPTVAADPQQALEIADAEAAAEAIRKSTGETAALDPEPEKADLPKEETVEVSQASVARRLGAWRSEVAPGADQSGSEEPAAAVGGQREPSLEEMIATEQEKSPPIGLDPLSDDAPGERPRPTPAKAAKSSTTIWVILLLFVIVALVLAYFQLSKEEEQPAEKPTIDQPKTSAPVAEKKTVTLAVKSTPAGAKVLVDGKDTGKVTPTEISGLAADREIAVAFDLPGKKRVSQKVKPRAGAPLVVELTEPAARRVRFLSEPAGATVKVNGRKVGETPAVYDKPLKPARDKISFGLDGYTPSEIVAPKEAKWTRENDDEVWNIAVKLTQKPIAKAAPKKPAPTAAKRVPKKARAPAATQPKTQVTKAPTAQKKKPTGLKPAPKKAASPPAAPITATATSVDDNETDENATDENASVDGGLEDELDEVPDRVPSAATTKTRPVADEKSAVRLPAWGDN